MIHNICCCLSPFSTKIPSFDGKGELGFGWGRIHCGKRWFLLMWKWVMGHLEVDSFPSSPITRLLSNAFFVSAFIVQPLARQFPNDAILRWRGNESGVDFKEQTRDSWKARKRPPGQKIVYRAERRTTNTTSEKRTQVTNHRAEKWPQPEKWPQQEKNPRMIEKRP